jgi:hypothetical protein
VLTSYSGFDNFVFISYAHKDKEIVIDIHNVDVYKIVRLDHKSGEEFKMFEYCAGQPLHTEAKCHCVYQTNIPKSPYEHFYSKPELFFKIAIEADTSVFTKFDEDSTYQNKGKFYANISFKIENPFTVNDKLVELKREGEAAEGFNSKCFEKIKISD